MDLERVWRQREEEIYPRLFGPLGRGIFPLTQQLFADQFGQADLDPRWLFMGVLEFPPTPARPSWLYATSGYSNPWDVEPADYDAAGESGSGVEFILEVSEQGDWAVRIQLSMFALDLLLSAGRFPGGRPLSIYDRIPLRRPLNEDPNCAIRNLIVVEKRGEPRQFQLASGKVTLVGFTGVTDDELAFAKSSGSPALLDRLRLAGLDSVTGPQRRSVL